MTNERAAAGDRARPGDFYFENGLLVFTAAYHMRRGYCCKSGCRHCPFLKTADTATDAPQSGAGIDVPKV